MSRWWRLHPDGTTTPTADPFEGLQSIDERVVGKTQISDEIEVSTVFLSLDHSHYAESVPILFETMIFGGPYDQWQTRYATKAEAQQGHDETVEDLRAGRAPRWAS